MENGFDKLFSGFATNSILCGHRILLFRIMVSKKGRQLSLHLPDMDLLEKKKSHRLIIFRLKTPEEILEILVNK